MFNRETEVLIKLKIDWDNQSKEDVQLANFIINNICDNRNEFISNVVNELIKDCYKLNICSNCGNNNIECKCGRGLKLITQ